MDDVEIRPARPDDAEAVARYHRLCFEHTYAAELAAGELRAADRAGVQRDLSDRFLPGSGCDTFVAVVDDAPIGHVTVSEHQLVHLFVHPDRHGTGLGRRLLELGDATMVAGGHTELELHTRVDNVAAIAFYQRAGWRVTDRTIHTVEHGISYDELVLVKPVGGRDPLLDHDPR